MFQRGHEEILKGLTRVFYPDLDRLGCICWHGVTRNVLPKGGRASRLRGSANVTSPINRVVILSGEFLVDDRRQSCLEHRLQGFF